MTIKVPGYLDGYVDYFLNNTANEVSLKMIQKVSDFGKSIGLEQVGEDPVLLAVLFMPGHRQAWEILFENFHQDTCGVKRQNKRTASYFVLRAKAQSLLPDGEKGVKDWLKKLAEDGCSWDGTYVLVSIWKTFALEILKDFIWAKDQTLKIINPDDRHNFYLFQGKEAEVEEDLKEIFSRVYVSIDELETMGLVRQLLAMEFPKGEDRKKNAKFRDLFAKVICLLIYKERERQKLEKFQEKSPIEMLRHL